MLYSNFSIQSRTNLQELSRIAKSLLSLKYVVNNQRTFFVQFFTWKMKQKLHFDKGH